MGSIPPIYKKLLVLLLLLKKQGQIVPEILDNTSGFELVVRKQVPKLIDAVETTLPPTVVVGLFGNEPHEHEDHQVEQFLLAVLPTHLLPSQQQRNGPRNVLQQELSQTLQQFSQLIRVQFIQHI